MKAVPGCDGAYQPVETVCTPRAGEYHCRVCGAHVGASLRGGNQMVAVPHEAVSRTVVSDTPTDTADVTLGPVGA